MGLSGPSCNSPAVDHVFLKRRGWALAGVIILGCRYISAPAIFTLVQIPASRTKRKMRDERSKEIGLSASGFCSESNPSPGTMISTPVFGYELFVAHQKHDSFCRSDNWKLFTAVHQFRWAEVDRLSSTIRRAYRPWRKPWRSGFDSRHGVPPLDHATCPS